MTGNPETFRPTDLERGMLDYLLSKGYSKSEVIRLGIRLVYSADDTTLKNMLSEPARMMVGTVQDGKITFHPDWAAENDK